MPELTAQDLTQVTSEINKYADEVDALAKSNGVDIKVGQNDPAELTKAAAAGAAAGAGTAAAFAAAAGPFAPAVIAAGAIIGALAGFFAKFKFGPSADAIALTKEFDNLNVTIHAILLKVPQPYRDQIALVVINSMKRQPGPFPFCLEGGGCAMTSIQGVRDAAAGLNDLIKQWLESRLKPAPLVTPRRLGLGLFFAAIAAGGIYAARERGKAR